MRARHSPYFSYETEPLLDACGSDGVRDREGTSENRKSEARRTAALGTCGEETEIWKRREASNIACDKIVESIGSRSTQKRPCGAEADNRALGAP